MTHSVIVKDEARDSPRDQGTAAFKAENEKLKQRKQVGKNDMENDRQNQWQIPIEKKIKRVQKRTNCLRKKIEILSVISFIEDAMRGLSKYRQQMKNHSGI